MAALLAACTSEARTLATDQPQSPPAGADDPRAARYQDNVYQVAQGGRYFTWYGCGGCHATGATGVRDLGDGQWRHGGGFAQVYAFIAQGHRGPGKPYGRRVPVEQLWQITAYVRDLPREDMRKRHRLDVEQVGEPQGATWAGPVR